MEIRYAMSWHKVVYEVVDASETRDHLSPFTPNQAEIWVDSARGPYLALIKGLRVDGKTTGASFSVRPDGTVRPYLDDGEIPEWLDDVIQMALQVQPPDMKAGQPQ